MGYKGLKGFNTLKTTMTQPPVLPLPDFTQQFVIQTDASGSGMGAFLTQMVTLFLILAKFYVLHC